MGLKKQKRVPARGTIRKRKNFSRPKIERLMKKRAAIPRRETDFLRGMVRQIMLELNYPNLLEKGP